jgi:signal transduction histidine kinase
MEERAMMDIPATLSALCERIAALAAAADALALAFAGAPNEDVSIIVAQAHKATATLAEVQAAIGGERAILSTLLHRMNNDLTGALSIASLCREDTSDDDRRAALDAIERAGRAAAEQVRLLSAALKA